MSCCKRGRRGLYPSPETTLVFRCRLICERNEYIINIDRDNRLLTMFDHAQGKSPYAMGHERDDLNSDQARKLEVSF
jgi:hypothetical protein